MIGIYIITHKDSFKRYVGQSIDITDRLRKHWYKLSQNKHENKHLQRAYNKYGRDAFSVSTIECAEDLLTKIEQSMLDQWSNLYNMCKTANVPPSQKGKKRGPMSEERRKINSRALLGVPKSAEARANMVKAQRTHIVWQHIEEIKAKRLSGLSYTKIGKDYNCGFNLIRRICAL